MSDINTNGTVEGTNRLENGGKADKPVKKGKAKSQTVTGFQSYLDRARGRSTKKSVSLVAVNGEAKVTLTVKSFPGFTAEDVTSAAESGVTISGKCVQKIEGKPVTFKEVGEGEEGGDMAADFFGIESNAE